MLESRGTVRRLFRGITVAVLALQTGCLPPWGYYYPEVRQQQEAVRRRNVVYPPFDESEYLAYTQPGTARIYGDAKWRDGKIVIDGPKDAVVTLDPKTTYSKVWWEDGSGPYAGQLLDPLPDERFLQYRRTTKLDAKGAFELKDVPAGTYYLRTLVSWQPEIYPIHVSQGDKKWVEYMRRSPGSLTVAFAEVTVAEGQALKVHLCEGYSCPKKPQPKKGRS